MITVAFALLANLAPENRLILIDQSDFGANLGFYLSIEAVGEGDSAIPLGAARLILAVADGTRWRFLKVDPHLALGSKATVDAEITETGATLKLNEVEVGKQSGAFKAIDKKLTVGDVPSWAASPAEYRVIPEEVKVKSMTTIDHTFAEASADPLAVFELPAPPTFDVPALKTPITLHATFRVEKPLAPSTVKGIVDRYGQAVAAEWPGKVKSDADITDSIKDEAKHTEGWARPEKTDPYGGTTDAWHAKATGFYQVVKHDGFWWLITPDGNPLFYTGICTAPALKWDVTPVTGREGLWAEPLPKDGLFKELWIKGAWGDSQEIDYFCPQSANLVRKFGAEWQQKATDELRDRVRRWGFSGLGKWSDKIPETTYLPVIDISVPKLGRHYDIFDPDVKAAIKESLRSQIEPERENPWILGWSIGNEYDEIITTEEVTAYLQLDPSHSLRKALEGYLSSKGLKKDDVEAARRFYARSYYAFLYKTVKEIDPNHLYFGFWIVPNWWQNEEDWSLIAPCVDVIGYDRYSPSYGGIESLFAKFDKPTLLGEFGFPAYYNGKRGLGRYLNYVQTDAESGERYAAVVGAASKDPKCVGTFWFQYRDQPITGRGPGRGPGAVIGEHYAFGLVDLSDRPKWDLVDRVHAANLAATPTRLKK